ncbi:MAG: response regulator transcription factor [Nostoc sp. TH1S01]|nr:response regulator transcription factor [Nostoc sp. TH1S01]
MDNVSLLQDVYSQTLTMTKIRYKDSSIQEKTIQPRIYISIITNSNLLREALTVLFHTHQHICLNDNHLNNADVNSTVMNSSKHLFLLDSGVGRDVALAQIQAWRLQHPSTYIIVLELKNDSDLILDFIEAGTHGYALQGASSAEVMQIIEQVCQGTAQCSPEITAKLFERLAQAKTVQQSNPKPVLTRRELEVLQYIAKNYSDRQIATELVIEVRTVKHHVHNILRKLNVKHRWKAAQLALENQFITFSNQTYPNNKIKI